MFTQGALPQSERDSLLGRDFLLDLLPWLLVGEGEHSTVGMVDEDNLARTKQALGDRQRADLIVAYHTACVADDVCVALLEPHVGVRLVSSISVHTSNPGKVPAK